MQASLTAGHAEEAGSASDDDSEDGDDHEAAKAADMEDLAGPFSKQSPQQIAAIGAPGQPKPMLTPVLRASLGKQGYKLIGPLHWMLHMTRHRLHLVT